MLFISDPAHLSAAVPGGVQVCTAEYRGLLRAAGFELIDFPVHHARDLATRVRVKLGADAYDRYDVRGMLPHLIEAVRGADVRWVAINQIALLPLGAALKRALGPAVRVIALSHGSESGDVAHEVARAGGEGGWRRRLAEWRLGRMVAMESRLFREGADFLLTLSEIDEAIARWQGAERTLVVPRTWAPAPAGRIWPRGVIGFLGSLHHKPNWDGLSAVLDSLATSDLTGVLVRVVGGPDERGRELARTRPFVDYRGALLDGALAGEIADWSVFINPVFWHARGASTKLAAAIGWGIPIVTTHAGARGYVELGDGVTWADRPDAMARAALDLARDDLSRAETAARTAALSRRSPQICTIARELGDALAALEAVS